MRDENEAMRLKEELKQRALRLISFLWWQPVRGVRAQRMMTMMLMRPKGAPLRKPNNVARLKERHEHYFP